MFVFCLRKVEVRPVVAYVLPTFLNLSAMGNFSLRERPLINPINLINYYHFYHPRGAVENFLKNLASKPDFRPCVCVR
jgi:hypothetical protein